MERLADVLDAQGRHTAAANMRLMAKSEIMNRPTKVTCDDEHKASSIVNDKLVE